MKESVSAEDNDSIELVYIELLHYLFCMSAVFRDCRSHNSTSAAQLNHAFEADMTLTRDVQGAPCRTEDGLNLFDPARASLPRTSIRIDEDSDVLVSLDIICV